MSPDQHYAIARAHQQEIISRANNSHRSRATRPAVKRHRSVKHRLGQAVAGLGIFVVAGTAVTVSDALSNPQPTKQHAAHVSAHRLEREINAFEAKGYVPTSCTVAALGCCSLASACASLSARARKPGVGRSLRMILSA